MLCSWEDSQVRWVWWVNKVGKIGLDLRSRLVRLMRWRMKGEWKREMLDPMEIGTWVLTDVSGYCPYYYA